ncbi:MAG: DUF1015 domain-containing protein [ANME-2 cluster archaeon]|nr:DUF1015 domain-containing protein [ANME-2 cluster archaeon]
MVTIKPFKSTILNPELPDRDRLVCPVYDTIDETEYARYGVESNNVIHITTRNKSIGSEEFIAGSTGNLKRFFRDGVLVEREKPGFYIYGIRYSLPEDILGQIPAAAKRDVYFAFGLVALVRVEGLGEGSIVGHERIFETHTVERYDVMKASGMNFAPIVAEYSMPGHDMNNMLEEYLGFRRPDLVIREDRPPLVDVSLKGIRHLLWEITDREMVGKIQAMMADRDLLILDGHHRYNAANELRLRDGVEYTMMMFMEGGDRALLLLPWHRCIRRLDREMLDSQIEQYFDVVWKGAPGDAFYGMLGARDDALDVRIGMYDGRDFTVLKAHGDEVERLSGCLDEKVGLDYISLNEWVIEPLANGDNVDNVGFVDSVAEAVRKVDEQGFMVAFLMRPLAIGDVEYKAYTEMKNFPQKSTLFLPKVAEGILMRRFRE